MIKNVLSDIGGVGLYGVISISLFFAVFIGMLIWVFGMKKSFAQSMSALPLNDGERRSSAGFQTCCVADFKVGIASQASTASDLEIRDTADLEVCATKGNSHE